MRGIAGGLLCLMVLTGCRGSQPAAEPIPAPYAMPPSTAMRPPRSYPEFQQRQAEAFDPYPQTELGPEVVGGRPRDFDKPRAEPVRGIWWQPWTWKWPGSK